MVERACPGVDVVMARESRGVGVAIKGEWGTGCQGVGWDTTIEA